MHCPTSKGRGWLGTLWTGETSVLLGMLVVLFHLLLSGKLVFLLCLQLLERLVSPSEMVLLGMASVLLGTPLDLRTLSQNWEMVWLVIAGALPWILEKETYP